MSAFQCRPVCEATHLVHGIDAGIDRHTVLLNVSLSFEAPLRVELWRTPWPVDQGARPLAPPMHRRFLRCGRGVMEMGPHEQPPDAPPFSPAQALESWAISNDWDPLGVGHDSDPLDAAASSQDLWKCADGEQGAIELHPAPTLGRLVSVTIDSHLVATRSASGTLAEEGYIAIAAAWDQICDMAEIEDAPPGVACRTVLTVTRLPVVAVSESCRDDPSDTNLY